MDIHRARFVPYPLSPITSLAFTRSNDKHNSGDLPLRLALGRKDGSIEIWNPQNGSWIQETRFVIDNGVVPESLVWTQDPDQTGFAGDVIVGQYRLFSFSSGGRVTEWDIERGISKRQTTGNLADIWCLTAQPRSPTSGKTQDLIAGCADGSLAVLTTEEDDLQFKRYLARVSGKKARCLTIVYQKPEVLVAGFADGMIRVYNSQSGSITRTMSLGASIPGAPKSNLVWKLLCLPDGDIVSSDSNGELRIWDGKSFSMKQRLSGHDRDCLDVVASSDGETIFSCGVDGRVAAYRRTIGDRGRSTWGKTSHRRVTQDGGPVKALAAYDGKTMSVMIGSSNDPAPILVPLRGYGKEHTRHLPFLPREAQVVSAPAARLVATWWDEYIFIYRFAPNDILERLRSEKRNVETLVARIKLKNSRVRSVSISPDGDLISAITNTGVHLYQLAPLNATGIAVKVRKVKLPRDMADAGAKLSALVGQDGVGAWLAVVNLRNEIMITRIIWSQTRSDRYEAADMVIELEGADRPQADQSGFSKYNSTVSQLVFSEDGRTLVASNLAGHVDYWELDGEYDIDQQCVEVAVKLGKTSQDTDDSDDSDDEDDTQVMLYGQTWRLGEHVLPKLESTPVVLTFRPMRTQSLIDSQLGDDAIPAHRRLLVVTARHQIYEFDIRDGQLSGWSKRNSSSSLPKDLSKIRDRVMGCVWDPRERLWLYGSNFVFMLDVSEDTQSQAQSKGKRKRKEHDNGSNKRIRDSGAGNVMTNGQVTGGPHTAKRTIAGKVSNIDLAGTSGVNGHVEEEADFLDYALSKPDMENVRGTQLAHWSTFKYRPILGIVPLSHAYRPADESQDVLEVVIIERPVAERNKQKAQK